MVSPNLPPDAGPSVSSGAITNARVVPDAVIRLAGNSQDGIQTIGGFLARLAGRTDQEVMTYMTIPSTISGGPSIFQVRMGSGAILSAGDQADFLVAFYQHSYESHINFLRPGGVLLYDSDQVKPNPEDKRFVSVGVPITSHTVESVGGTSKDKGKNIFVLGMIAQIFQLDVEKLRGLITERFGSRAGDVVRNAMLAFDAGYGLPLDNLLDFRFKFTTRSTGGTAKPQVTTDGNTAITMGLLAAGVRHGAAYPITPWSSVMEILRTELPKYGGVFVQAEDELAAIAQALGFAYAGHLSVTGSSGPGMSLKMEALGWAVMAEMPLIVINVQRGGPSTGMPTSVEQSDLMQAIYGSHGDCPRVVLAPRNVEDCFYIALEAARIARAYSTPVIVLSDQAVATRIEAFDEPDLAAVMVPPQLDLAERPADFKPYPLGQYTRHAPPGSRMASGIYPTVSGLEHDEAGHPSANSAVHARMNARRRDKIVDLGKTLPTPEIYGDTAGDILLVGWGSTFGSINEALGLLRADGKKIGQIHLRHLNPLPEGLPEIFKSYRTILVAELNDQGIYGYGQMATLLRARYANPAIRSFAKTDGLTFKVREIVDAVQRHLANPA